MNTTKFEEKLLAELKREVVLAAAEDGHRSRRLFTPTRAGVGLVAAAAAAGAFLVLPGGASSPAYAVQQGENGRVTVEIADWPHGKEEVEKFADKLADAGIATIYNPPKGYLCQPPDHARETGTAGPSLTGSGGHQPPPGAEPPAGGEVEDNSSHRSFVGGAEVIGPEVAQNRVDDPAPGGERGEHQQNEDGSDNAGGPDQFTYELRTGDTAILSDDGGQESIAFVRGACLPV